METSVKRPNELRFGLLCNSLQLERWQAEAISLLRENGIQLALIVINAEPPAPPPGVIERLRSYPFQKLLFRLWNRYVFRPKSKAPTDISKEVESIEKIYCTPLKKGLSNYFSPADISSIQSQKLDFLLRFGFNIIKGEILEAARFGVWSFHHDDERLIRGGPPGFWEFMQGHEYNGVILQKLTEELDKGLVLRRQFYKVIRHSYAAHLDQLYFESTLLPLQSCKDLLLDPDFEPEVSQSKAAIKHPPGNLQMIRYFLTAFYRRVGFHLNDLFFQEDWNIGLINTPINAFVEKPESYLKNIHWFVKPAPSSYLADPFVIAFQDETYVFFEQYDYRKGKAVLACALKSEDFRIYHTVLEEPHHLSFPFVFVYDDTLYCLPESYSANALNLYRFDVNTRKLNKVKTLLSGMAVVDPVLTNFKDRWYLFFTQKNLPSVHLYCYHAESPFGPFEPHANNPVKTDIRSARPAGNFFQIGEKPFRPAQDCTLHYGRAVEVNEIVRLSPQHFEEKPVKRIIPLPAFTYSKGLHSLNGNQNYTVIDGKRFTFTIAGFWNQLKLKLNKTT